MNHPWHCHPLQQLKHEEGEPFECSGCKELGFGPRYECSENYCNFLLHEVCFKARPTDRSIKHQFMCDCKFQFLWEPPGGPNHRLCDACGQDVRGFVYHDKYKHKLDLHPRCMNLKGTISDPNNRMDLILKDKMPSKCVECKRKDLNVMAKGTFRGWSYVSSCGNYCYHVYCVKKLFLDNWESGYFNVPSSSSSSFSSSSGERRLIRGERGSSSRSERSSMMTTSGTSFVEVARRGLSRSSFTRGLIKMAKIGFCIIISVLFGNPTPLFSALAENLLD